MSGPRRLPPTVALGIAFLVLGTASCRRYAEDLLGPRDWEVVLELADDWIYEMAGAPDGALFVSTFRGALYRSTTGHAGTWEAIVLPSASTPGSLRIRSIFAATGGTAFALDGQNVYRWDQGVGLQREQTPIADSIAWCDDPSCAPNLVSGFARSPRDVYVFDRLGMVLHGDETGWRVVPQRSGCEAVLSVSSQPVTGDSRFLYLASRGGLVRGAGDGCWESLALPRDSSGARGFVTGLAAGWPSPVVATQYTGASVWRFLQLQTDGTWRLLGAIDRRRAKDWFLASSQPPGRSVFWSFDGDFALLDGSGLRLLDASRLGQLRGAVATAEGVFLAAIADPASRVARLKP